MGAKTPVLLGLFFFFSLPPSSLAHHPLLFYSSMSVERRGQCTLCAKFSFECFFQFSSIEVEVS